MNESKSNVMLVTTRQRLNHIEETKLDVYIGEFKLVEAECIDYLGMNIDENISWNAQTDSLCKQLVFIVSRLSRLRKVIPSYMLAYIYISIIQPKIDYAITQYNTNYYCLLFMGHIIDQLGQVS